MNYWKFLRKGAISPFTGYVWEPQKWVDATRLHTCHEGFHACRASDLPYWLNDELWQVDLMPTIVTAARKVVAPRARLASRVASWTSESAQEFAEACAVRVVQHAVAELKTRSLSEEAELLAATVRDGRLVTQDSGTNREHGEFRSVPIARECAERAMNKSATEAVRLCSYVVDSIGAIEVYPTASVAYIAARAANQRSTSKHADPYAAERSWQADWIVDRLDLDTKESSAS
jgi:hypothetical protein